MRRIWARGMMLLDSTSFIGVTLLLYLCMASALPIDVDKGSLLYYLIREHPVLRPWFAIFIAASVAPFFLAGVWLKRWDPLLPISGIRNILAAMFLLMWVNPVHQYVSLAWYWQDPLGAIPLLQTGALLFAILILLFEVLAHAVENRVDVAEVPVDNLRVVEYWFMGWAIFYAVFAGLMMRALVFDRENSPYILAGVAMAYGCFRMVVRVRRQAGLGTTGMLLWANWVAGLWVFGTAAIWLSLALWG